MSLSLALASTSLASSRPVTVVVSPLPLASILDHHLRRGDDQDRVFGTLLGVRKELDNEVEIRNSFGVPYATKGRGEVTVDMDHHKSLLDLHLKVNPKEVVVGWYATSPNLNSFSALIHNFYTSESAPSPAVHLTLDPTTLSFAAYTASPIGTTPRADHLAFLPVETVMRVHEQERSGLDLLTTNLTSLQVQASASAAVPPPSSDLAVQSPLATLYSLLTRVSTMLDQVLEYVRAVAAGEREGDERVGRALLETVGVVPTSTSAVKGSTQQSSSQSFEEDFNAHLADVLMVSYLANLIKTQVEISSRLNLMV
ncbi:eukaryotic translation initiation factor 3 subunit F [Meredithblackwellia eburnea MCA 4105]